MLINIFLRFAEKVFYEKDIDIIDYGNASFLMW